MAIVLCSYNVFINAHKIVSVNLEVVSRDRYNERNHVELKIAYLQDDKSEPEQLDIPIYDYKNAVKTFQHIIEQIREQQPDKLFIDSKLFGDDNSFKNNSDFIKREMDAYTLSNEKCSRFCKIKIFIKRFFYKWR